MKPRPHSKKDRAPLCGQFGPGDGVDPRDDVRSSMPSKIDRKTLQLCRQVFEAIHYALSAETADELLQEMNVVRVDPAPDASRLLVTVTSLSPADELAPEVILARLSARSGFFRSGVARAISRRKTPVLSFQFVPHAGSGPASTEEGSHE